MPDLATRSNHEARIASAMRSLLNDQRERVARNPSSADWPSFRDRAAEVLTPLLAAVYLEAASGLLDDLGLEFGKAQFQQQAAQWATKYARVLAGELTSNLQQATSEAVARAHELAGDDVDQELRKHLAALLLLVFSESRALTVGITETTRLISAGEAWAAGSVRRTDAGRMVVVDHEGRPTGEELPPGEQLVGGRTLVAFWITERDGKVCPVCSELHGHRAEVWQSQFPSGPPAHPRCRCYLVWRVATLPKIP